MVQSKYCGRIRELDSWNIKTDPHKSSVIFLHHFTKEAMDSKNEYKGICNHKLALCVGVGRWEIHCHSCVFLVNAIYSYPSINKTIFSEFQNDRPFMAITCG